MPATRVSYKDYRGDRQEYTFEGILDRAGNDPAFQWPYPILKALLAEQERPTGVSVTMLNHHCLRCEVLKSAVDYTVDLTSLWPAWKGTMYHGVIDSNAQKGALSEVRFWAPVPGIDGAEIHGKPDLIIPPTRSIVDLKTTRQVPRWDNPWPDHVNQVQTYRWLVNHATKWAGDLGSFAPNDFVFDRLVLWYVDEDGPKPLEVRRKMQVATKAGAQNPYKGVKVPHVWTDEEVEGYVIPRYLEVVQAFKQFEEYRKLPAPPQDFMTHWIHRYSPVANLCVESWCREIAGDDPLKNLNLTKSS